MAMSDAELTTMAMDILSDFQHDDHDKNPFFDSNTCFMPSSRANHPPMIQSDSDSYSSPLPSIPSGSRRDVLSHSQPQSLPIWHSPNGNALNQKKRSHRHIQSLQNSKSNTNSNTTSNLRRIGNKKRGVKRWKRKHVPKQNTVSKRKERDRDRSIMINNKMPCISRTISPDSFTVIGDSPFIKDSESSFSREATPSHKSPNYSRPSNASMQSQSSETPVVSLNSYRTDRSRNRMEFEQNNSDSVTLDMDMITSCLSPMTRKRRTVAPQSAMIPDFTFKSDPDLDLERDQKMESVPIERVNERVQIELIHQRNESRDIDDHHKGGSGRRRSRKTECRGNPFRSRSPMTPKRTIPYSYFDEMADSVQCTPSPKGRHFVIHSRDQNDSIEMLEDSEHEATNHFGDVDDDDDDHVCFEFAFENTINMGTGTQSGVSLPDKSRRNAGSLGRVTRVHKKKTTRF